jgi:hypothetical protein
MIMMRNLVIGLVLMSLLGAAAPTAPAACCPSSPEPTLAQESCCASAPCVSARETGAPAWLHRGEAVAGTSWSNPFTRGTAPSVGVTPSFSLAQPDRLSQLGSPPVTTPFAIILPLRL